MFLAELAICPIFLQKTGLIRTGRCQGSEANDEATFQLGLDSNLGPSGWQRATIELSPSSSETFLLDPECEWNKELQRKYMLSS